MLSHHIQKNSPGLLYIPAKYEKSAPYSIGAIAKTKCGAGGAGGSGGAGRAGGLASPIYKQASREGHLILHHLVDQLAFDLLNRQFLPIFGRKLCNVTSLNLAANTDRSVRIFQ